MIFKPAVGVFGHIKPRVKVDRLLIASSFASEAAIKFLAIIT